MGLKLMDLNGKVGKILKAKKLGHKDAKTPRKLFTRIHFKKQLSNSRLSYAKVEKETKKLSIVCFKKIKPLFIQRLTSIILLASILLIGCKKDLTETTDITNFTWELKSITTHDTTEYRPNERSHRPEAYLLIFENDSEFMLETSSNMAGGNYENPQNGQIEIIDYHLFTLVGTTEFDDKLIEVFNEVSTYEVIGKILVIKGAKGDVEFKRN